MLADRRIAVLGMGTMGRTLAGGLLRSESTSANALRGTVRHADKVATLAEEFGISVGTSNVEATREADIVLLCVKPKSVRDVVSELAGAGSKR